MHIDKDRIEVDGRQVRTPKHVHFMLNKPRGLVTTLSDEKGRHTVYSCLSSDLPWVAPVGRLDKASEGLLLFTNDSEWSARILAPEAHIEKTYHVQLGVVADSGLIERLMEGVISDGNLLRVKQARLLRSGQRNCWIEVVLDEGKNRHIRRMLKERGVDVLRLVRVAIGPLELGDLRKGAFREITAEERRALDEAIGVNERERNAVVPQSVRTIRLQQR